MSWSEVLATGTGMLISSLPFAHFEQRTRECIDTKEYFYIFTDCIHKCGRSTVKVGHSSVLKSLLAHHKRTGLGSDSGLRSLGNTVLIRAIIEDSGTAHVAHLHLVMELCCAVHRLAIVYAEHCKLSFAGVK